MAIIKCKMCGGDIELATDKTLGTCEFCGSTMTFPKVDDEQRAAAFNRGNHFRRIGEFDKALAVYERIVREDDTDAEAHWCCALCRFGIEYVEDPATYEYLPTCHRASFDSFLEDVDYLAAVEHSEGITKRQYQKDGAKIAEVQRGILTTSQNEEPFDIFICYKESDENGERTRDSLMAQEVYYQLTEQGYRVFFARITLEDMAGKQYEPYIFAALNSAKVMIVIGTKAEYMNAVWVKNEWSRFLAMMKKDRHKLLLPCYRDMDPYDMPEQLSVLQSYDMAKIGFVQDLIRGIKKVLDAEKKTEPVKETIAGSNTAPLLKRAFMFLEDGDWKSADEYCEKVLDLDPECAEAYVGKLMAELQVKKQDGLKDQAESFDGRNNYQKAIRFANDKLKTELFGYIEHIDTRNENTRLNGIYIKAESAMRCAVTEVDYKSAEEIFRTILHYKDAATLADQCAEKAEIARKNEIYNRAKGLMQSNDHTKIMHAIPLFESISGWQDADNLKALCPGRADEAHKDSIYNLHKRLFTCAGKPIEEEWAAAQKGFESISGWRDADALAQQCAEQIEIIKIEKAERERKAEEERIERERKAEVERLEAERAREEAAQIAKRNKKIAIITAPIACVIIAFVIVLVTVIIPISNYNRAIALLDAGKYTEAVSAFEALGDYKDSAEKVKECKYNNALALMESEKYEEAIDVFEEITAYDPIYDKYIEDYKDSSNKIDACKAAILEKKYNDAVALMESGKLDEAYSILQKLGDYKNAAEMVGNIQLTKTKEQLKNAKVGDCVKFGAYEEKDVEWLVLEVKDEKLLVISKYALAAQEYHHDGVNPITWEKCDLREWLNNDFINKSFNANEKAMIPAVTVPADKNPEHNTRPGNATQDKVFLLSIAEVEKYFDSDGARQCEANTWGIRTNDDNIAVWWLRSPGCSGNFATIVGVTGELDKYGFFVDLEDIGVRPAMWIDLNA